MNEAVYLQALNRARKLTSTLEWKRLREMPPQITDDSIGFEYIKGLIKAILAKDEGMIARYMNANLEAMLINAYNVNYDPQITIFELEE